MNKVIAFFFFFLAIVVLGIFTTLGVIFAKESNSNFEIQGKVVNITPYTVVFQNAELMPQDSAPFNVNNGDILNFYVQDGSKSGGFHLTKTITSKNDDLLYIFPSSIENSKSIMNATIINGSAEIVQITADGTHISSLAPRGSLKLAVYEGEKIGFGGLTYFIISDLSLPVILYQEGGNVSALNST